MTAKQAVATAENVQFHDAHPDSVDCRSEVLAGLARQPRQLDPKWFYDEAGSVLFEEITRLPEYYPTRTEKRILSEQGAAIAQRCGPDCVFIEPGAGNCDKARLLLDELRPSSFVPLDISADFLLDAALSLGRDHPWLPVNAICADFRDFASFETQLPAGRRVVFYPGSTIGNLDPGDASIFLSEVRALVGDTGGALIGVDLHKPTERLEAAYNDAAGVTARFNLNILPRLNDLLGADFDADHFSHLAFYNEAERRIEMHLVSERTQRVTIGDRTFEFAEGERLHTESSYKYTVDGFAELARGAGFTLAQTWTDAEALFSVHYLEPGPLPQATP